MGCGKSKHDVVAGTISQSKKSNAEQETSNAKSVKIVHEKAVNGDINNVNGSLGVVGNAKPDTNGETIDATKVYVKEEIHEAKADNLDQPKRDDSSNVDEEQGHEVLIPGDSLKEEGNIDGVISDGVSGKTAYYSPANDKENAPVEEMAPETKTALVPTFSEEVEGKEQLPVTEEVEAATQVIIPEREEVVPTTTTEETEVMTPVKEEVVAPTTTTEEAEVITKEVPVEEEVVPTKTTDEVVVTEETPASEEEVPSTQGEIVPISNEDIAAETKKDVPKTK